MAIRLKTDFFFFSDGFHNSKSFPPKYIGTATGQSPSFAALVLKAPRGAARVQGPRALIRAARVPGLPSLEGCGLSSAEQLRTQQMSKTRMER